MLTTDPNDPNLCRGIDDKPTEQCSTYLVLPEEERKKGFIRPVRRKYVHVGIDPIFIENTQIFKKYGKNGCGCLTIMGVALAETYARDPKFYGATYCMCCQKHLPVQEFMWDGTIEIVGS